MKRTASTGRQNSGPTVSKRKTAALCCPTGGINLSTIADFLKAGACAVGLGGALVEPKAVQTGDMARIKSLAQQYVEAVKKTRASLSM